ncbi:MAG TPA: hypothetical protein VFL59_02800 [Candidatus Nanopelagicales bacterium]|nr:hypothetical protein [Candidatus Nanopelagicales bacterium]
MWVSDDGVQHVIELPDPADVLTPPALESFARLVSERGADLVELDLDDRLIALAETGFAPDTDGRFVERAPAAGLLDGDLSSLDALDAALARIDPRWQVDLLFALQSLLHGG